MDKNNMVVTALSREQFLALKKAKMESVDTESLVESVQGFRAQSIYMLVKVLVSQVGKEKAKELIEEAQYSIFYNRGREAAEKAGNPTDMASFLEARDVDLLGNFPSVPPVEIIEKTEKRYVDRCTKCVEAKSLQKVAAGEPEIFEVVKHCCPHDTAWANGFNPSMKFERTKFLLDGDDCCEFVCEVGG